MSRFNPRPMLASRRFVSVLGILVSFYIAICAFFWATQVSIILAPLAEIPTNPKRMGMDYKEATIPLRDDRNNLIGHLDAYWVPVEDPEAPVFLYLHGQDATIGKNLEHTERFHQWGWNVLVIDYRGFGESFKDEQPSETKVYEDASAALKYLKVDRGFAPNRIFIYGHSLGGAVAIELASKPENSDVAGLVVESTFTSILEMSTQRYFGLLAAIPVRLLLTEKFDSVRKINFVKLPILFIHGDNDAKVPRDMTEDLFSAAQEPKQKCIISGAGHENCGSIGKVQYHDALVEFVSSSQKKSKK